MANNFTAILPTIYRAADTVSREFIGFIGGAFRNSSAAGAAKDQTITYDVVPTMAAGDVSASNVLPAGTDQTIGSGTMTISKSRSVSWPSTGEEQLGMRNGDQPLGSSILQRQFEQAFRTLANELESDAWLAAYKGSSRAYGTAGTTPFGTAADLTDFSKVAEILDQNGAPPLDRHLVLGSAAMSNLRGKQSVLFKVNEAGTEELLRKGMIDEVMGFGIHNSYPIGAHTKGTGAGYLINMAGTLLVGGTDVTVDTGAGTILAGDLVTFAGTTDKYVVNSALAANVFSIGKPGSLAIEADNDAVTVGNNYTPNVAFHRDAFHIITRTPAMPEGGDAADDVTEIVDARSGLAFQIAIYRERRQVVYEVGLAWGVKAVKPAHIATLIG